MEFQGIIEDSLSWESSLSTEKKIGLPRSVQSGPPFTQLTVQPLPMDQQFYPEFSRKAGPVYLKPLQSYTLCTTTKPSLNTIIPHYKTVHP